MVNETHFFEADNLGDRLSNRVKSLKSYCESKDYAIGDSDNNVLLEETTKISGDMNMVVMKQNAVVIVFNEVPVGETNASAISAN